MFQNLIELPVFPYTTNKDRLQVSDRRLGTVDASVTSLLITPDAITSIQEYECTFTEIQKNSDKKHSSKEVKINIKFCCINTLNSQVYTLLDKESLTKLINEHEQKRWLKTWPTMNTKEQEEYSIEKLKTVADEIKRASEAQTFEFETPKEVIKSEDLFQ